MPRTAPRHPLVELLAGTPPYRRLLSFFALRCAGFYAAQLAGVWGAWRFGGPSRAGWLVAATCLAAVLGARVVGRSADRRTRWAPVLITASVGEALACVVLALSGVHALAPAAQLAAGMVVGITGTMFNAAINPAAVHTAHTRPSLALAGVGWSFDAGKLAAGLLVAGVLLWWPSIAVLAAAVAVGGIRFATLSCAALRDAAVMPSTEPAARLASSTPTPAPASPGVSSPRRTALRAIWVVTLAAIWGQQGLLMRHATTSPVLYGVLFAAFALGALVGASRLAHALVGHPPSRARWGVVLVAQCGTALLMAYPPRPLVAVLASAGFGATSGWAFQLSRVLLILADPPRAGHHSASMAALTTLAGALGAPLLAALLGVPWILLSLAGVCVLVAVLVAPDPRPTLAVAPL